MGRKSKKHNDVVIGEDGGARQAHGRLLSTLVTHHQDKAGLCDAVRKEIANGTYISHQLTSDANIFVLVTVLSLLRLSLSRTHRSESKVRER